MATSKELTAAAEHMRRVAAERSREGYHLSSRAILDVVEMMLSEATTARCAELRHRDRPIASATLDAIRESVSKATAMLADAVKETT